MSPAAARDYQSQWQRAGRQKWTFRGVPDIRFAPDGKHATVDCEVTIMSATAGGPETTSDRRATFTIERLDRAPIWMLVSVSGL